jgi:hypothetical protein
MEPMKDAVEALLKGFGEAQSAYFEEEVRRPAMTKVSGECLVERDGPYPCLFGCLEEALTLGSVAKANSSARPALASTRFHHSLRVPRVAPMAAIL